MGLVVKTIGTATRDYSTLAAWEASLPANLVTDGNSYEGDCYNDSEFTAGVAFASHTTDASHTVTLTTGAGQSFQDNANVRTNALRYNQSNGVGIKNTSSYTNLIDIGNDVKNLTISKLQISNQGVNGDDRCLYAGFFSTNRVHLFKDLILDITGTGYMFNVEGDASIAVNVVCIKRNSGTANPAVRSFDGTSKFIGCTIVRPTNFTAGGTGMIVYKYCVGAPIAQSCAIFGFITPMGKEGSQNWDATNSKFNATEQASGLVGVSNQVSVAYSAATPFTQASSASSTQDFRAIASTTLASNGFLDATNAPNDITATARASSPTIGAWELVSAATAPHIPSIQLQPVNNYNFDIVSV